MLLNLAAACPTPNIAHWIFLTICILAGLSQIKRLADRKGLAFASILIGTLLKVPYAT